MDNKTNYVDYQHFVCSSAVENYLKTFRQDSLATFNIKYILCFGNAQGDIEFLIINLK